MSRQLSPVRRVPEFPREKSGGLLGVLQFLVGILIWLGLLILFVIGLWAWWFGRSVSWLLGKPKRKVPWWFSWLCTIFLFPLTVIVILLAEGGKFLKSS